MKKIIIVLDGVADRPNKSLNYMTPLEYADTPSLDSLAKRSKLLSVKTIPDGLEVGSAVANMSLLALDPEMYKGRAAIEAAGCGLQTKKGNLYLRLNFVQFEGDSYHTSKIVSYNANDITSEQSAPLTELLREKLFKKPYNIYNVGSFRNIVEIEGGEGLYPLNLAQAHDIIGQDINLYIKGEKEKPLFELQEKAYEILKGNPTSANGVWFWGQSVVPEFKKNTRNRCALGETLILEGILAIAGIDNIKSDDTLGHEAFFAQKLNNALKAIEKYDDVYIHFQSTDDLSHELKPVEKAEFIEAFDRMFLPKLIGAIKCEYVLAITSDHFTFSDNGSHGAEPVPCLVYTDGEGDGRVFTEQNGRDSGKVVSAQELHALLGGDRK